MADGCDEIFRFLTSSCSSLFLGFLFLLWMARIGYHGFGMESTKQIMTCLISMDACFYDRTIALHLSVTAMKRYVQFPIATLVFSLARIDELTEKKLKRLDACFSHPSRTIY